MKIVNLVIILMFLLTNAQGQTCTPELIPTNRDYTMTVYPSIKNFFSIGDKLFFIADSKDTNRSNLYQYDGHKPPEPISKDILGDIQVSDIIPQKASNGNLYFIGHSKGEHTEYLYCWNAKNQVLKIKKVQEEYFYSIKEFLFAANKQYIFQNDILYYIEHEHTYLGDQTALIAINTETNTFKILTSHISDISSLFTFKGKIYYTTITPLYEIPRKCRLVCYDPNSGVVDILKDETVDAPDFYYTQPVVLKDKIVMQRCTKSLGCELYTYDGIGDFKLVKDLASGSDDGVTSIVAYKNKVYFGGKEQEKGRYHLYVYNPTDNKISTVHKFAHKDTLEYPIEMLGVGNNKLYINTGGDGKTTEVYQYEDGTGKVLKLASFSYASYDLVPNSFVSFQKAVYLLMTGGLSCWGAYDCNIIKLNCKNL